jgi:hypothetical protein
MTNFIIYRELHSIPNFYVQNSALEFEVWSFWFGKDNHFKLAVSEYLILSPVK